jgi:two-component system alkaline phosphatase synthesis response regulator PhoP
LLFIYYYIYQCKRKFAKYEKKHTKILLVDDEPDILEIVGYNLNQEGYQIFTAANGKEAIAKAKGIA